MLSLETLEETLWNQGESWGIVGNRGKELRYQGNDSTEISLKKVCRYHIVFSIQIVWLGGWKPPLRVWFLFFLTLFERCA